jgi:hypothetical protein
MPMVVRPAPDDGIELGDQRSSWGLPIVSGYFPDMAQERFDAGHSQFD